MACRVRGSRKARDIVGDSVHFANCRRLIVHNVEVTRSVKCDGARTVQIRTGSGAAISAVRRRGRGGDAGIRRDNTSDSIHATDAVIPLFENEDIALRIDRQVTRRTYVRRSGQSPITGVARSAFSRTDREDTGRRNLANDLVSVIRKVEIASGVEGGGIRLVYLRERRLAPVASVARRARTHNGTQKAGSDRNRLACARERSNSDEPEQTSGNLQYSELRH